jgi:hypothetical protein
VTLRALARINLRAIERIVVRLRRELGGATAAEEVARRIGTIGYEVVCEISGRVPRSYHRDGEPSP